MPDSATRRRRTHVIAYDIPSDDRRTRLREILLGVGVPVQYSVFECRLAPWELRRLLARLRSVLQLSDALAVYRLCTCCEPRTIRIGLSPVETRILVV